MRAEAVGSLGAEESMTNNFLVRKNRIDLPTENERPLALIRPALPGSFSRKREKEACRACE